MLAVRKDMNPKVKTVEFKEVGVTLYLGNSLEVLKTLKGPFDLLLTDPPTQQAYQSLHRPKTYQIMKGDWQNRKNTSTIQSILQDCVYKLKPYRHMYVFGSSRLNTLSWIGKPVPLVWDKEFPGMGDLEMTPRGLSHESIQFSWYTPDHSSRKRGGGRLGARLRQGSVLRGSRMGNTGRRHPTEKPVSILRQMIESSSCIQETILDPFMGSGSSIIAAMLEGRRAVGIEIDPIYFAIAENRVKFLASKLAEFDEHRF
jgi:DNA modification methylase